jgi:hypothetical protein
VKYAKQGLALLLFSKIRAHTGQVRTFRYMDDASSLLQSGYVMSPMMSMSPRTLFVQVTPHAPPAGAAFLWTSCSAAGRAGRIRPEPHKERK